MKEATSQEIMTVTAARLLRDDVARRRLHDDFDLRQYGVGLGRPDLRRAGHFSHALDDERLPLLVHAFSIRQVDVDLFFLFFHELEEWDVVGNELFLRGRLLLLLLWG